jgi:hypothetical protein
MTLVRFPHDLEIAVLADAIHPLGLRLRSTLAGHLEAEYRREQEIESNDPYIASPHFNANGYWADSFARKGEAVWCVFKGTQMIARVETREQAERVISLGQGIRP